MSLFGTDGVRGRAGVGPLSDEGAERIGRAFGAVVVGPVAIARDPRESGEALRDAVAAGLRASGADVIDLGVLPTPALSWWLAQRDGVAGGVMITASHNPWHDNGIKFFAGDGTKASDATQRAVEAAMSGADDSLREGATTSEDILDAYLASLPTSGVGGTVVADHASGAAYAALPAALEQAGANVVVAAPAPDGRNINEGWGAVHPEALAKAVVEAGAYGGVAVDGDGDRVTLVDEIGAIHDGDAILGFLATELAAEGSLPGDLVIGTVTTNSGLERFLGASDIRLLRSKVGDRHVAALMDEHGARLGGESSGHVLTPDLCPTGDGIRVAVEVLRRAAGRPLSLLLGAVPRDPSAKRTVRVGARPALDSLPPLVALLTEADAALASAGGRRLLRYSGTEPVLRIQVEGPDADLVERWADLLADCARGCIPSEGTPRP